MQFDKACAAILMKHLVDDDDCSLLHSKACFSFEFILLTSSFNSYESFSTTKLVAFLFVCSDLFTQYGTDAINRGAQNLKIIECGVRGEGR